MIGVEEQLEGLTEHEQETVRQLAFAANIASLTSTVMLMQTLVGEVLYALKERSEEDTVRVCADAARAIDDLVIRLENEAHEAFAAAAGRLRK